MLASGGLPGHVSLGRGDQIALHFESLALACSLCQRRFAQQSTFAVLVISSSHKHWSCGVACTLPMCSFIVSTHVPIGMCKLTMEISDIPGFMGGGHESCSRIIVEGVKVYLFPKPSPETNPARMQSANRPGYIYGPPGHGMAEHRSNWAL